jgi:hypothetical protein
VRKRSSSRGNFILDFLEPRQLFDAVNPVIMGSESSDNILIGLNSAGTVVQVFVNSSPFFEPTFTYPLADVQSMAVEGIGGDDTMTLDSALPFTPRFNGGPGNARINIQAGRHDLGNLFAGELAGLSVSVGNDGVMDVGNPQVEIAQLSLTGSSQVKLAPGKHAVMRVNDLVVAGEARLDLADNALVHRANEDTSVAVLENLAQMIASARGQNGGWDGPGITSSNAAAFPGRLTGLVIAANQQDNGGKLPGYEGDAATDIVIGYSFNGDANLDRKVNIDDYIAIDNGFLQGLGGLGLYNRGDFNLDTVINIDDYILIDNAFLGQTELP